MDETVIDMDPGKVFVQKLRHGRFENRQLSLDVLRLDCIHPVVSGNKWFKLELAIAAALKLKSAGIVSFGGAYSNHLVALAYVCHQYGLPSKAIIRGEEPQAYSESLLQMKRYGMELLFVSREAYRRKDKIPGIDPGYFYIPEGGQSNEGITGAGNILSLLPSNHYSHIICPVGTGTTMTGLINSSLPGQQVMGISSLKIAEGSANELSSYINSHALHANYKINYDYHFGGYAKKTPELIRFMNELYRDCQLPTDFVYTGKMFFGIMDMIQKDHFKNGDRLLAIHTGGLQGNKSLPAGSLDF